jgi:hypothetical protein
MIDLIIIAFVVAFGSVAALGHILLVAALFAGRNRVAKASARTPEDVVYAPPAPLRRAA